MADSFKTRKYQSPPNRGLVLELEVSRSDNVHLTPISCQKGDGVAQCESTAMLWRARAAGAGHAIAQAQMAGITRSGGGFAQQ